MKRILIYAVLPGMLALMAIQSLNGQGTAFSYQGQLNQNGSPAAGSYDLTFTLFGGSSGGSAVAGPLTNSAVLVSNGLFIATLDFGSAPFTGSLRWLEIGVRTNGNGVFSTLSPRQQLTPTPYAIFATTASNVSGTISGAQLGGTYGNPVTFNNGANTFDGSFYGQFFGSSFVGGNFVGSFIGSGVGLADVWHTTGNLGNPAGSFLGTLDNQPVVIKVNGQEAMRYESTTETPNVIGGWSGNQVQAGLPGVTIGGGGAAHLFNGKQQPNFVTNNGSYATIAGGYNNMVGGYGGAVLGGSVNSITGDFGVIGGGQFQTIESGAGYSVIAGGVYNTIQSNAYYAVISGGYNNISSGPWSVTAGGYFNTNNGLVAFIGAGDYNNITTNAAYSVIGGGFGNTMDGYLGTLGGGWGNAESSYGGAMVGGLFNTIEPNSDYAFIGGGYTNTIQSFSGLSVIGGGYFNIIQTNSGYSVIGGGNNNSVGTNAGRSFIGGGWLNNIQGNSDQSVVVGGNANGIQTSARESFVGGGFANVIQNGALGSFLGAGFHNTNASPVSVIVGGNNNFIQTNAGSSFIGGGFGHNIQFNAFNSFIGGGAYNTAAGGLSTSVGGEGNAALVNNSTVVGGLFNTNFGVLSFIGGGDNNLAGGYGSVIAGGESNRTAGSYSMAAGYLANSLHDGTFVWADYTPATFSSTRSNQFLIRAQNGVGINTNNPQSALHVNGIVTASGFAGDGSSLLGLSASQLTSGTLPGGDLAGTYGNAVTFNNPANSFTGNGAGLTGVNAATLGGLASSSFWKTSGNAGTTPGANFIGTTDGQALLIKGSFVGVGRSTRITLSEYFGVEAPAGSGAFGGMYVNASAGGLPFYGYSQGGGGGVYHYVDGTDGNKWKLFVSTSVAITATPTGLVGIGTTVPDATLTVAGSADKPGGGAWGVFSDARLKKNIRPLAGALDRLLQLQGVTFEYKDPQAIHELAGVQIGMIAQEVEKVFPDWVETAPNGMKRLSIHGFESLTVEALRELRAEKGAKIAELEKANAEMRSQLAAQKESLARLEARFAALETADGQRAGKSAATLAASEDR